MSRLREAELVARDVQYCFVRRFGDDDPEQHRRDQAKLIRADRAATLRWAAEQYPWEAEQPMRFLIELAEKVATDG